MTSRIAESQNRALANLQAYYEQWVAAAREVDGAYKGSMRWKVVTGKQYLYHRVSASPLIETSLGRRVPTTEARLIAFQQGKVVATARHSRALAAVSRFAKGARALDLAWCHRRRRACCAQTARRCVAGAARAGRCRGVRMPAATARLACTARCGHRGGAAHRLHGHPARHHEHGPGGQRRHRGGAPGRRARQAGLDVALARWRVALAAGARRFAVVSADADFPAATPRSMGAGDRARLRSVARCLNPACTRLTIHVGSA